MTDVRRLVDLVLVTTAGAPAGPHEQDLVMLGTLSDGRAFWPCELWGQDAQRSDFHATGPCRRCAAIA